MRILLALLFISNFAFANDVDLMTWPAQLTSTEVLHIFTQLMKEDPPSSNLLSQVQKKLNQRGIKSLSEIFRFCDEKTDTAEAGAYFFQTTQVFETRFVIPGFAKEPWSKEAHQEVKKSFASKVLKTPYLEHLLISRNPEICIYKGARLFDAYKAVLHEMIHLANHDPFFIEEMYVHSRPLENIAALEVNRAGGEFEAFKFDIAAEIRLINRLGLKNFATNMHRYFDDKGELVDADGLRTNLLTNYQNFYEKRNAHANYETKRREFLEIKLRNLKDILRPSVVEMGSAKILRDLDLEIDKHTKMLESMN